MKKFKKILSVALMFTVLTSSSLTTVYAEDNKNLSDVQKINVASDVPYYINPSFAHSSAERILIPQLFKGLYTLKPSGVVEPALVKTAKVSEDGTVWTFTIRDFEWTSGNKGTAHDFVASYITNLREYGFGDLFVLKNAEEYSNGLATAEEVGVKAIDDKTLEITLKEPIPYFEKLLVNNVFLPIDSENQKQHSNWYESEEYFSSNGPFKVASWEPDEFIKIVKNENYYKKDLTVLDEINFISTGDINTTMSMYNEGKLDLVNNVYPEEVENFYSNPSETIYITEELSTYYLVFNTEVKPLNNPKVRKALSMAIDRESMLSDNSLIATPAYTITPTGLLDDKNEDYVTSLGETFTEDFIEAKKLLKESLAEEGMSLKDFKVEYVFNNSATHERIAKSVVEDWKTNLGIEATTKNEEFQELLYDRTMGDFEIARAGWVGDYLDPMTFLASYHTDSSLNDGNWSNAEYDELIDKAKYNMNPSERMEQMREAEHILMNEMPIIPLYHYTNLRFQKHYLDGVYMDMYGYPNFEFAYVEKSYDRALSILKNKK